MPVIFFDGLCPYCLSQFRLRIPLNSRTSISKSPIVQTTVSLDLDSQNKYAPGKSVSVGEIAEKIRSELKEANLLKKREDENGQE